MRYNINTRIELGSATLQQLLNAKVRASDHFVSSNARKSYASNERSQPSYLEQVAGLHFQVEFTNHHKPAKSHLRTTSSINAATLSVTLLKYSSAFF
jgi:hypothetical protein